MFLANFNKANFSKIRVLHHGDGSTSGLPCLLLLLSLLLDVTGGGMGREIPNWLELASGARGA
jgi:hypothetical protein